MTQSGIQTPDKEVNILFMDHLLMSSRTGVTNFKIISFWPTLYISIQQIYTDNCDKYYC